MNVFPAQAGGALPFSRVKMAEGRVEVGAQIKTYEGGMGSGDLVHVSEGGSPDVVDIVIGDVAGKSATADPVRMMVLTILDGAAVRRTKQASPSASAPLATLDRQLNHLADRGVLATPPETTGAELAAATDVTDLKPAQLNAASVALARLNTKTGGLHFARAGDVGRGLIIWRKANNTIERHDFTGLRGNIVGSYEPHGLKSKGTYSTGLVPPSDIVLTMQPGDMAMMETDGVPLRKDRMPKVGESLPVARSSARDWNLKTFASWMTDPKPEFEGEPAGHLADDTGLVVWRYDGP